VGRSKRMATILGALVMAMTTVVVASTVAPAQAVVVGVPDRIYSYYNSKCMDVDSSRGGANGSKIQLWECIGSASNQQWYLTHVYTSGDGIRYYNVVSRAYFKCLDADVSSGPVSYGTKVQLWDCLPGASNQRWRIDDRAPAGTRWLRSHANTGFVMDADTSRGSVNGMKIQMWACCAGGNNKLFFSSIF